MAKNIDVAKITPSIHDDDEKEQPVNYRGIKAMPFIIGNETFEKLGTVGSSANLVVYLSSVFNMTSVSATTFVNVFNGTTNFAPLVGAFLSDTYFGRYNSLAFASVASFLVEFYYKEFPENMRSIAGSAFFMGLAVASYLSGFLVSVVHRVSSGGGGDWLPEDLNAGRLDWFYYLIGGLGVVNFGYFLVCARWYRYKGDVAVGGDGVNMGMENKESDGSVLA